MNDAAILIKYAHEWTERTGYCGTSLDTVLREAKRFSPLELRRDYNPTYRDWPVIVNNYIVFSSASRERSSAVLAFLTRILQDCPEEMSTTF